MEMRRWMVAKVHLDHDPEEAADAWHGVSLAGQRDREADNRFRTRRGRDRYTVLAMPDAPDMDEFESLVADAIDRLPEEFQEVIARVAVVVSDLGGEAGAYGQYFGDGVASERYEDRIVIYRDTLERDFGHDRELLARQVERTLRHELAHHLGWDERGVGGLGL